VIPQRIFLLTHNFWARFFPCTIIWLRQVPGFVLQSSAALAAMVHAVDELVSSYFAKPRVYRELERKPQRHLKPQNVNNVSSDCLDAAQQIKALVLGAPMLVNVA
jgi:hypothetical protein